MKSILLETIRKLGYSESDFVITDDEPDEETKKKLVDQINEAVLNAWGCPQEAVTISLEEVEPADWNEKVKEQEILPNEDKMMILNGQKKYE